MLKKIATIFVVILLLPVFISAQEHTVLRSDGSVVIHKGDLRNLEVQKIKKGISGNLGQQNVFKTLPSVPNSPNNVIDTLIVPGDWNTNFGFFGQDVMVQWFVAPADLFINKVGFACFENADGMTIEVKVVKLNWTLDEIMNAEVAWRGYYEAIGNGFNDITAFMDNPDVTGPWTSIDGSPEIYGNDLWSDGGIGFPMVPTGNSVEPVYEWVDLSVLGVPTVLIGEIFGIVLKHAGPDMDANRIGWWSATLNRPAFKFYANGRLQTGVDFGWWSREFTWNYVAEVELFGDRGPVISSFTHFSSGLDTGPFTVDAVITDDNPGDPPNSGVASAILKWSDDDGATWNDVAMVNTSGDNFSGDIPLQPSNTNIEYYIVAEDVAGLITETEHVLFFVFGASSSNLVVFNGYAGVTGYPQEFYYGSGDWPNSFETMAFDHDVWAYGPLVAAVLDNYTNVIEINTSGPADINNDAVRTWLEADPNHNYMIAGDEWLGTQSGWVNGPHIAGEFHFDILGINFEYNDVNFGATGDQLLPSEVYPQAGTMLGGDLKTLYDQVSADSGWTAPMQHDPWFEIGVSNWIDGVDFEADVEVDMQGLGADGVTYNVAGHRTLPAGNKIAFFGYDPLSLNSDAATMNEYWWYGFMDVAPQVKVLEWFGIAVSVELANDLIPDEFTMSQNYPNPFNPSTTIEFSVPNQSNVVLKVYDVLGSEVATLVDGFKNAGNYQVNFDASKLASGLYIYTLTAGNFTTSKKMMLMK